MPEPLIDYIARIEHRSRAEFLREHPDAVFVIAPFQTLEDTTGFNTINMKALKTPGNGYEVAPIRKRAGSNAFTTMVTIGRAQNNDIELKAPGISKFHAYVRMESDGAHLLTDAGSSYGTTVNETRLVPRSDKPTLEAKDEVVLGESVRLRYLPPADFYEFLCTIGATANGTPS